jgi:hypothetical protein
MNNGYIFRGYLNFMMFCRVNLDKLFLGSDDADMLALKNQVDLFLKAANSISGGCPCNKGKRRQTAHKIYKDTINMLSKNETLKTRITDLLNGAEQVLFLHGEDNGNQKGVAEDPFVIIHKPTVRPIAVDPTASPPTETSGRQPPIPPSQ